MNHWVVQKRYLMRWRLNSEQHGGAQTYLQLVNMVKIQFTNLTDLLPQIQGFQDNYNLIMLNGHSRLSKDLVAQVFWTHMNQLPGNISIT